MSAAASSFAGGPAYYNEHDPYAAQWLRNLITAGHIAPGHVDERSIVDVRPADLAGPGQRHFFAGIAGWSLALRLAGVPDDLAAWTGSCPCQPFSAAGRRGGFDDERHLWPAWFDLIRACRPALVFGEQVEAAVRLGWLDTVFADLEGAGYACRATVLGAHSVGAPHIRQRLWFVAYAAEARLIRSEDAGTDRSDPRPLQSRGQGLAGVRKPERGSSTLILGDAKCFGFRGEGRGPDAGATRGVPHPNREREWVRSDAGAAGATRGFGDALRAGRESRHLAEDLPTGSAQPASGSDFWSDLEWLPCQDGKARPTRPGLQPLAHGVSARVGKLRAAGNAIVPQVAAAFIAASMDALGIQPAPTRNPAPMPLFAAE